NDDRQAEHAQHLSQHRQHILGAHQAAIEQGQAGHDHQKHQSGGNAHPNKIRFIHVVDSYSAASSYSPVRMRTACSRGVMKILPSPILPVWAAAHSVSIACSSMASETAMSMRSLGRKSTV